MCALFEDGCYGIANPQVPVALSALGHQGLFMYAPFGDKDKMSRGSRIQIIVLILSILSENPLDFIYSQIKMHDSIYMMNRIARADH